MADFSSMTVTQLRAECTARSLGVSGTRPVLIARLNDYEGSTSASAPAAAPKATGKKVAAAAKKTAQSNPKKRKAEEITPAADMDEEEAPVKAPPAKRGKGTAAKVDPHYVGSGSIYVDADNIWDVMLMQVSIERNNNKFYVIQMIDCGGTYDVFTRWGRVDEAGESQNVCKGASLATAKSAFSKKFKDKTKNNWGPGIRENFVPAPASDKKYTLMDMADEEELEEASSSVVTVKTAVRESGKAPKIRPCTLDAELQSVLALCFNEDTITEQLQKFEIDTNKMPIGKISRAQLEKGRGVLEKLARVVAKEQSGDLGVLTSEFYTYVPHSFKRNSKPTILNTKELIQQKFDMINTLTDMAVVQDILAKDKDESSHLEEVDHPLDRQYKSLDCDIETLKPGNEEYKYVQKYFESTKDSALKLKGIFKINRKSEAARYSEHDKLTNRRLLWHGTNIAVVVAILKTGLRIMPHSGGRVGRGIYHASENSKSSGYVGTSKRTGIMFVDEVALGKIKEIYKDDHTIVKAPAGFDSVLAVGWTEPDPKHDITIQLDGRDVFVPQAAPISQSKVSESRFSQSEYLVYKESQVRMRYMLRIEFPW